MAESTSTAQTEITAKSTFQIKKLPEKEGIFVDEKNQKMIDKEIGKRQRGA